MSKINQLCFVRVDFKFYCYNNVLSLSRFKPEGFCKSFFSVVADESA
jgi:hypothetical protein